MSLGTYAEDLGCKVHNIPIVPALMPIFEVMSLNPLNMNITAPKPFPNKAKVRPLVRQHWKVNCTFFNEGA